MQSDLEEGLTLSRDEDAMVITGFNASYRELNYIVGTVSDHLLILNGDVYSLRELCGRNAHISIYFKGKKSGMWNRGFFHKSSANTLLFRSLS